MYRSCIFCSAGLGANEAVERFPVGSSLAFDAAKGRLWAVCPRCLRWNLAPLEERWEAVEEAERRFTDARLRVSSENVGLAKLPDGTRLVRVGQALPGELAAWRYGTQLVSRRRRYALLTVGAGLAAGAVVFGVPHLAAVAGVTLSGGSGLLNLGTLFYQHRHAQKVVHRLDAAESPTGEAVTLRRHQLNGARVTTDPDGALALLLPDALESRPETEIDGRTVWSMPSLLLRGEAARSVMGRAMVDANAAGASRGDVRRATDLLAGAGGAEEYLLGAGEDGLRLGLRRSQSFRRGVHLRRAVGQLRGEVVPPGAPRMEPRPPKARVLALEMALHEARERQALEGELSALEAAWREAEEIAAIADRLPGSPDDEGVT